MTRGLVHCDLCARRNSAHTAHGTLPFTALHAHAHVHVHAHVVSRLAGRAREGFRHTVRRVVRGLGLGRAFL